MKKFQEPIHVPAQFPKSPRPKIAFIAEAPGTDELESGQPLTGSSGKVFNSMLRTAGLDRYEFYISNVFDEKLPGNEVANWCADLKTAKENNFMTLPPLGSKGWLKPDYHYHLERLKAELETIRPTVIVPLGATALWAFTGSEQISQFRGTVMEAKLLTPGAKLLPTFHPAFVMRQWKYYPVVVGDFIKAIREADIGPQIEHPKRELLIEPLLKDIEDYIPRLLASDLLSVDIETGWGQITCLGFAPDQEHAICIPFVDQRKPDRSYWKTIEEEEQVWDLVKQVMESPVPKLGQNFAGYDAYWFMKKMDIVPRNLLHDTRLMHHALYPELPKSLEFMGASYTRQGAWKNWGHRAMEKRDD